MSSRRRRGSIASDSRGRESGEGANGQKGKALFHPIRDRADRPRGGPELDLAVPAIDRGADLPASAGIPTISATASARPLSQTLNSQSQLCRR
jgi:hypothetical protein